ncbi:hypothetical protein CRE_19736 [Caenorhabditis remanei]|uniref:F-box domain-containing protein n=1 Tax=Caenorhabditis remanei TaxID=31234 RepID=E3MTI5_CAERE|nr:hypothetical protein CRE_19736 [Caenorhabditis remanei]
MSEILKNNPTALRACIYYEFLREKNVEEAYKNFCKTVGVDVIDYVDFEYWFYRFYHGNLDLDHERSADPKSLILTDLPMELLNEIVGKLDIQDRFNVRNVSRKFEKVVDKFKSKYDDITIYIGDEEVHFHLDDYYANYEKGENDWFVQFFFECVAFHSNISLSALSAVLTNSKSPIECFCISTGLPETIDIMPKLINTLSKDVSPLFYAKRVELDSLHKDFIIPILSLFKSGVLEHLQLNDVGIDDDTINQLVEMDQFKQLKSFNMSEPLSLSQFKRLSHLSTFEVRMDHVSTEEIIILRDILSQFVNLRSGHISLCSFMKLSEIGTSLGIDYDNSALITYRHRILNSDKSLILNIDRCRVEVSIENN